MDTTYLLKRHVVRIHPDLQLHLGNTHITVKHVIKFLGLYFDSKLTFHAQTLHLRKKCEKSLKVLSNASSGSDRDSLLRFYRAISIVKCIMDLRFMAPLIYSWKHGYNAPHFFED